MIVSCALSRQSIVRLGFTLVGAPTELRGKLGSASIDRRLTADQSSVTRIPFVLARLMASSVPPLRFGATSANISSAISTVS